MIVQYVLDMQALALNEEWENALILSICFESTKMSGCSVWAFERNVGFTDRLLLGSFTKKMSKQRTHVCYDTFRLFFWWEVKSVFVEEKYTYERDNFNWE